MATSESLRHLVVARAGGACEYCRLLQAASGVTFHIEHVVPRSLKGKSTLRNLALSCPGCNLCKAERVSGHGDEGNLRELFSPRDYQPWLLGWHLHFELDLARGIIVPRSPVGEATVNTLRMNDALRISARKLLISAGLIE
jgi:hypothetical protein